MYKRNEYLQSTDTIKQAMALSNEGLNWNYKIAPLIDRDLHEKLLPFDSKLLMDFIQILPLIRSGYFDTAKSLVQNLTVDESLNDVKQWLIQTLNEANEV